MVVEPGSGRVPLAEEVGDLDDEHVGVPVDLERDPDRRRVSRRDLVGVDREDPLTPAVGDGFVARPAEVVVPVALDDRGAGVAGDGHGGVRGSRVVDHHLVDQAREAGEASWQVLLLVLDDQRCREERAAPASVADRVEMADLVIHGRLRQVCVGAEDVHLLRHHDVEPPDHQLVAEAVDGLGVEGIGVADLHLLEQVDTHGEAPWLDAIGPVVQGAVLLGPRGDLRGQVAGAGGRRHWELTALGRVPRR